MKSALQNTKNNNAKEHIMGTMVVQLEKMDQRLVEILSTLEFDLKVGVAEIKSYIIDCVYEARLDIDLSHEICMQQDQHDKYVYIHTQVCKVDEGEKQRTHKLCMLVIRSLITLISQRCLNRQGGFIEHNR